MTDGSRRFDYFALFAEMRTGSNYLEASLNEVSGVTSHGELFNPYFIGRKNQTELFGLNLAAREADPARLIRVMRETTPGLPGFRYFHDHDPRVLALVLPDPRCAKIILTRNPLESYVSRKIAAQTGQWMLKDAKHLKSARIRFDPAEFEVHLTDHQAFQAQLLNGLQISGQTAFYLSYEDIGDLAVLNGLARFLGGGALQAPSIIIKKQNPEEISEKVTNPEEMAAALAGLDRFDLARTPNFEPRRGALLPLFQAAAKASLLYQPIRATGSARIAQWLAALDGATQDQLQTGFSQKTLKLWRKSHPGHLTFTLIRHPLLRAHAAFCAMILTNALPEIRTMLKRAYKVPLPDPERMDAYDLVRHHDAFLAFLGVLKANLAGQTGFRVDGSWASQSVVIQGFAQVAPPDLILREARAADGLAYLATQMGRDSPALTPDAASTPFALADIYDADLETAAQDAYQRDYVGFGFGPWTA